MDTSPMMHVTDGIPKPERDARLYRRVTFPNGLEALLISDPSLVRAQSPASIDYSFGPSH